MIAAAGTGVAAVEHEFLGAEAGLPRFLVQRHRGRDQFMPRRCGLDVDLDDAGIGRDAQHPYPDVARRCVALDDHRQGCGMGGVLDRGKERGVILQSRKRRHEDMYMTVARLHREGRLHDFTRLGASRAAASGAPHIVAPRQSFLGSERIDGRLVVDFFRQHVRQRPERQPEPERRISRQRVKPLAAQRPWARFPDGVSAVVPLGTGLERQDVTTWFVQPREQKSREPRALVGIGEIAPERIRVDWKRSLVLEEPWHVLVSGDDQPLGQPERRRESRRERARVGSSVRARLPRIGEECAVVP